MRRSSRLFLLTILILLTNCSRERHPELKVGVLLWPPYEVFYLADSLGYYDDAHIDLVTFNSPAEALRGYRNNLLDAVALTNQFLPALINRDTSHKVVMVIDHSHGGDALLAKKEIGNIGGLRGKTVIAEAGPLGLYMLARALHLNGMDLDDIKLKTVDMGAQAEVFQADSIDAVVTYEPYRTILLQQGARELFNSSQIPYEISDVLITTTETIGNNKKNLNSLISGFFKAANYLNKNPQEAAAIMSKREHLTGQQMLSALRGTKIADVAENKLLFKKPDGAFYVTLDSISRTLEKIGMADTAPDFSAVVDARFIGELD